MPSAPSPASRLSGSDAWPTPVRELVRAALEAQSPADRHFRLFLALEASIRLGVAALRPDVRDPRRFDTPAVGTWASALASAHKRAADAGIDTFDKSLLCDTDVRSAVAHFNPALRGIETLAVGALLEAVAAHRNGTIGHAGLLDDEAHERGFAHVACVLQCGWSAGLFLPPRAHLASRPPPSGGPLAEVVVEWDGDGARSLDPWIVDTARGDRLFLNRRTGRASAYLNYLTGVSPTTAELGAAGAELQARLDTLLGAPETSSSALAGAARYEALWPIGAGGMSELFLGHDRTKNTRVVLKRPLVRVHGGEELARRLGRETALLEKLRGKHIEGVVGYLDRFDDTRGPVLVMEYVDGCTLERFARGLDGDEAPEEILLRHATARSRPSIPDGPTTRRTTGGGRGWSLQSVRTYLDLVRQAAGALDVVHGLDVLHNDLTPANIMVRAARDGLASVIIDFGLAKAVDGSTRLTKVGGTGRFLAPEVHDGRISRLSDVYAIGAILDAELLDAASRTHRLGALPRGQRRRLARLADRCMSRAPERRPASAAQVAAELADIIEGRGREVSPPVVGLVAIPLVLLGAFAARDCASPRTGATASPAATSLAAPTASTPTTTSAPAAPTSPPSALASTPPAPSLGENCTTWVSAARNGRFEGSFGRELNDLARRIATRKLKGAYPNDFEANPDALPCAAETREAWTLYVLAAKESTAGWQNNQSLRMSDQLRAALVEAHRGGTWNDSTHATIVLEKVRALVGRTSTRKERETAVRACEFARAVVDPPPGECNLVLPATTAKP